MFTHAYHKALEKQWDKTNKKKKLEDTMEEKILLLRHRGGSTTWWTILDRDMLDKWMKDGSVVDGDYILICKDYKYYKAESETKLNLVKV